MAKSNKPKPAAVPPAEPDKMVGEAHPPARDGTQDDLLTAIAQRLHEMRTWVRREIALAAAGVSEDERRELNP